MAADGVRIKVRQRRTLPVVSSSAGMAVSREAPTPAYVKADLGSILLCRSKLPAAHVGGAPIHWANAAGWLAVRVQVARDHRGKALSGRPVWIPESNGAGSCTSRGALGSAEAQHTAVGAGRRLAAIAATAPGMRHDTIAAHRRPGR